MTNKLYRAVTHIANCDPSVVIPNTYEIKRLCVFCGVTLPLYDKPHLFAHHAKDCLFVQNKRFFRGLQTARLQLEAVELRIKRYSYQQIANVLNIGKTEAYQLVQTALQETQEMCSEKTDELRALELQSLDELERGLWTRFEKDDDLAAASLILKAKEARAKLTGLNKIEPVVNEYVGTKVYVTVNLDRWDEIIVAKKSKELHP